MISGDGQCDSPDKYASETTKNTIVYCETIEVQNKFSIME